MKLQACVIALAAVLITTIATPSFAQEVLPRDNGPLEYHQSPDYRESESHPLRIVAYVLHPVGWFAREVFFRPFSAFVSSSEITRSVFGYRDPYDYRNPSCFTGGESIPDCKTLAPYSTIADFSGAEVVVFDEEESMEVVGEMAAVGGSQVYVPDVAFDLNASSLNPLGKGRVRQVAQLLSSVPSLQIVVEGHTDSMGGDAYNQALGQKRAEAVAAELVELGVDPARLSKVSFGEERPVFSEETDWAHAVNRRVQLSVQG